VCRRVALNSFDTLLILHGQPADMGPPISSALHVELAAEQTSTRQVCETSVTEEGRGRLALAPWLWPLL